MVKNHSDNEIKVLFNGIIYSYMASYMVKNHSDNEIKVLFNGVSYSYMASDIW